MRCVLWHAPGAPVPETLLSALARRGIGFVARTSACRALAEAAALALEWPQDRCVLLMVEPADLPRADEVRALLDARPLRVVPWVFEASAPVQLRAATPPIEAAQAASSAPAPHHTAPVPRPQVVIPEGLRSRLAMPGPVNAAPDKPPNGHTAQAPVSPSRSPHAAPLDREHDDSGLLSSEELDILLGRTTGEAR